MSVDKKMTGYPYMSIEDAVAAVRQIKEKLGKGPYSRDEIARALGHNGLSGPACNKISAFIQFGLLDRSGNAYALSQTSLRIIAPINDDEVYAATLEAVRKPRLYAELISKYEGQALPTALNNILVREYGVSEKIVVRTVNNFKKSLAAAGILKNGIVLAAKVGEAEVRSKESRDAAENADSAEPGEKMEVVARENAQPGITIMIPDTEIKVVFPEKYAFGLATGVFKDGLESLRKMAVGERGKA